jgi:hypothetical protein
MGFGSASTMDFGQLLYSMQLMQAQSPWMKQTYEKQAQFSDNPESAYSPMENWDQFIKQKYTDPAQYSLKQNLMNLQNTPERFSFGRQYREMQAMNQSNSGLAGNVSNELMNERQIQYGMQNNALARQLQSLGAEGRNIFAPLGVKTKENTAKPVTAFEELFKMF